MIRNSQEFGALVRDKRKSVGMTQEDLAAKSGVTRAFLIALEGGKDTCQIGKALVVAAEVGIAFGDLNDVKESVVIVPEEDEDLSHIPRF